MKKFEVRMLVYAIYEDRCLIKDYISAYDLRH